VGFCWGVFFFIAFQANCSIVPGTESGHLRGLEYRGMIIGNVVVTVHEIQGLHYMTLRNPAVNAEVIQAGPL
jgi:hypothetical protein